MSALSPTQNLSQERLADAHKHRQELGRLANKGGTRGSAKPARGLFSIAVASHAFPSDEFARLIRLELPGRISLRDKVLLSPRNESYVSGMAEEARGISGPDSLAAYGWLA